MIESMHSLVNLHTLELFVYDNSVRDFAFLRQLPKLTRLHFRAGVVPCDTVPHLLAVAPQLRHFACASVESIWSGAVDTVAAEIFARSFTELEKLTIRQSDLQDLLTIAHMTNLRDLKLAVQSPVGEIDVTPLQKLVRREKLWLWTSCAFDISPLAMLPRLESLIASSTSRRNQQRSTQQSRPQVAHFSRLRSLQLRSYVDGDEWPLAHIVAPQLREINVRTADINDLPRQFPRLRALGLTCGRSDTSADVLTVAIRLQHLQSLHILRYPHAIDIQQLARLPRLVELMLFDCIGFTSLDGIEQLPSLQRLNLSLRSLQPTVALDLSPLERLTHLETLRLSGYSIGDVSPLTRMPRLRRVEVPNHVNCQSLVNAYHLNRLRPTGSPSTLDLEQIEQGEMVLHMKNCLWGYRYYSDQVKVQLLQAVNRAVLATTLSSLMEPAEDDNDNAASP